MTDDPLVTLGRQWLEAYDNWENARPADDTPDEEMAAAEKRKSDLGQIAWSIEDRASEVPAQSLAGVLAQLRMAGTHYHLMDRHCGEWMDKYAQLTWQAWNGLERLVGTVAIKEPVIDGALLELERRMLIARNLIDDPETDTTEVLETEWQDTQDQIAEMPASSLAGIAIKLRLVHANKDWMGDGDFADKALLSTIASVERLAGDGVTEAPQAPAASDAALFDAIAEYDRLVTIREGLEHRAGVFRPGIPEAEEATKAQEAAWDEVLAAWKVVQAIPATTQAGLFARLQATDRFMSHLNEDDLYDEDWCIIKADVRRIAGRARP